MSWRMPCSARSDLLLLPERTRVPSQPSPQADLPRSARRTAHKSTASSVGCGVFESPSFLGTARGGVDCVPGSTNGAVLHMTLHGCPIDSWDTGTLPLETGLVVQFASLSEVILLRQKFRLRRAQPYELRKQGNVSIDIYSRGVSRWWSGMPLHGGRTPSLSRTLACQQARKSTRNRDYCSGPGSAASLFTSRRMSAWFWVLKASHYIPSSAPV